MRGIRGLGAPKTWHFPPTALRPVTLPPTLPACPSFPLSSPQVLVDLFVNYDCALQAANLYERTIKAIRRLMALPDAGPGAPFPPPVAQKLRATALKALLAAIKSLDTWAGPITSAAAAVALTADAAGGAAGSMGDAAGGGSEGELAAGAGEQPHDREVRRWSGRACSAALALAVLVAGCLALPLSFAPSSPPCMRCRAAATLVCLAQELQRILADKELKDALLSGTQLFNQSAVKGAPGRGWRRAAALGFPAAAGLAACLPQPPPLPAAHLTLLSCTLPQASRR